MSTLSRPAVPPPSGAHAAVTGPREAAGLSRIDSRALFASHRQIVIAHGGARYVLRITQQNKLILTK